MSERTRKALEPLPGGPFPRTGDLIKDLFPQCPRHPGSGEHIYHDQNWCVGCHAERAERSRAIGLLRGAATLIGWMEKDPLLETRAAARQARQVFAEMKEWYLDHGTLSEELPDERA